MADDVIVVIPYQADFFGEIQSSLLWLLVFVMGII